MKVIRLTESQFHRLFESNAAPSFDDEDIKEYNGSEVSTTANVQDSDGNVKYGHMPDSDEFANKQTYQGFLNSQGNHLGNNALNY